jgi:glycosyltransferase involved in cell wall biosynthesis
MTFPLVTIGLPVYNGERFLAPCLDSLLAQDYANVEIVVSDNASTDATPAILADYASRDMRIRLFREQQNRGGAWNHTRVADLARGAYFKWCGADDICHPHFVRACVDALESQPEAVLAYPLTVVIDEAGQDVARTTDRLPVDSPDVVQRFGSVLSALSVTHNVFYGLARWNALARALPEGAFPAADRCLVGRMALLGPFAVIPEFLMYRRQHGGNMRTQTVEQRFYKPADRGGYHPREWRVLYEHLRAIARAPLALVTKLRLLRRVASWALEKRRDLAAEGRGLVAAVLERGT